MVSYGYSASQLVSYLVIVGGCWLQLAIVSWSQLQIGTVSCSGSEITHIRSVGSSICNLQSTEFKSFKPTKHASIKARENTGMQHDRKIQH